MSRSMPLLAPWLHAQRAAVLGQTARNLHVSSMKKSCEHPRLCPASQPLEKFRSYLQGSCLSAVA